MVNYWKKRTNKIYNPFYRNYSPKGKRFDNNRWRTEIGVGEGYGGGWQVDIFNKRFDDGTNLRNFKDKKSAIKWMKNWMKKHPK